MVRDTTTLIISLKIELSVTAPYKKMCQLKAIDKIVEQDTTAVENLYPKQQPSYQLPITNYQLPITNYLLPITNYQFHYQQVFSSFVVGIILTMQSL